MHPVAPCTNVLESFHAQQVAQMKRNNWDRKVKYYRCKTHSTRHIVELCTVADEYPNAKILEKCFHFDLKFTINKQVKNLFLYIIGMIYILRNIS